MVMVRTVARLIGEQIGCIPETGSLPFPTLFKNKNDISPVREVQLIRYRVTPPEIWRCSYGKHESR